MAILNDTQINGNLNATEDIQAVNLTASGSVQIGGSPVADFVIEQGTSGIWRYKKWNSGEVELTARTGINCSVQTQVNSVYKSAIQSVQLPFTVYKCAPIVTCLDHNACASSSPISDDASSIGVVFWRGGTYAAYTWACLL